MSQKIETYPLLYDPKIKALNDLADIDFDLTQTLPTIEEIEKAKGNEKKPDETKEEFQQKLVESGILDDLNQLVNDSSEDYRSIIRPKYTDDITINNMIEDDIEEYYSKRVYAQATMICDFLDGLVQLDNYPIDMFGQYKMIHKVIVATENNDERARALNQLRIMARSIIPVHTREERVEIVEPSLITPSSVREG